MGQAPSRFTSVRYGRLTLKDVKEACDNLGSGIPGGTKWSKMSTQQLLKIQGQITKGPEAEERWEVKKS